MNLYLDISIGQWSCTHGHWEYCEVWPKTQCIYNGRCSDGCGGEVVTHRYEYFEKKSKKKGHMTRFLLLNTQPKNQIKTKQTKKLGAGPMRWVWWRKPCDKHGAKVANITWDGGHDGGHGLEVTGMDMDMHPYGMYTYGCMSQFQISTHLSNRLQYMLSL